MDFAIGLVIFVLNLPNGQVQFFGKFKLQKDQSKRVLRLIEMTCGLVHYILATACPNGRL